MRTRHKYKENEIKLRRCDLEYPLFCCKCKKKIEKGSKYYSKKAYEAHFECVDEDEKRAM